MADPEISFLLNDTDSVPLFEIPVRLLRKELNPTMRSNQTRHVGEVLPPINFDAAAKMMFAVNIQETCIRTKRDATVGLGFEGEEEKQARERQKELDDKAHSMAMEGPDAKPKPKAKPPADAKQAVAKAVEEMADKPQSKVEELLDPLCGDEGFQSLLNRVGEDYENTGNGYIEVVRDGGEITALWHMPAAAVRVYVEEERPHFHYVVQDQSGTLKYARFGDLEEMQSRVDVQQELVTELIHFRQPTSFDPYYGIPSWLSCTSWLELAQKVMQYDFDYFNNRAVPDLAVLITGAKVPDSDLKLLSDSLKETVGAGKRHRTLVSNLSHPEAKVQVERLNADNRERFSDLWTNIQLQIVSTHRVPPLLAGVVLPGKMAAANELPNALVAFQTLYIAQHQRIFEQTLRRTLGGEGGVGLQPGDLRLRKITDFYDMGQMDTMARMRETATEASLRGRELEDGLKD